MILEEGYKTVGLNSQYDSLEDPRIGGYVFYVLTKNKECYGSKKQINFLGPSKLTFQYSEYPIIHMETDSSIELLDEYDGKKGNKIIGVIKDNLKKTQHNFFNGIKDHVPSCFVQCGEIIKYSVEIEILGPCTLLYDSVNKHILAGKVWIETDSEVIMIGEKN